MKPDKIIRNALWLSVPFNFMAAFMMAYPASFAGQLAGLPLEVPAPYPEILGFFILLFGVVYGWLALQRHISRELVGLAAIGKTGVFMIVGLLWISGAADAGLAILVCGDLAFAVVFFWWLLRTARYANR